MTCWRLWSRGGFAVEALGVDGDLLAAAAAIDEFAPDVVFNLCESIGGDNRFEPLLPLLLERADIAYTGSPPLTLGLALHKHKAKERAARLRAADARSDAGLRRRTSRP